MPDVTQLLDPALLDRITGLSITARRVVEGALHGLHRSPQHGLSVEFAQHRQYAPGDELKHIDWKVLAKSDRYVVKQYEQETNLRALLVLDTSASMGYGTLANSSANTRTTDAASPATESKIHHARVLSAALAYLLLHQGDSVGLVLAGENNSHRLEPSGNPNHLMALAHALLQHEPAGRVNLPDTLRQLASGLRRRSLIVVLSDLFDDPHATLAALGQAHHAGHEILVLHVLHPTEMHFDLGAAAQGVTVIRDMESGREFESEPALIRALVQDEVRKFLDDIDTAARRHGLHVLRCRTDEPAQDTLTRYLHNRAASGGAGRQAR